MKQYLICAFYPNEKPGYSLSKSRNAMMHINAKGARSIEVYDKDGWLLSRAERNAAGIAYRPRLFLDGEPRNIYKRIYEELRNG